MVELIEINNKNSKEAADILKNVFYYCSEKELKFFDNYKIDKSIVVDGKNYYISNNNTIVGICGFYIPLVDKDAAWLSWLAIKEDYKNKGYASEAISIIEKYCESDYNIKTFRVYTSNKNKPAINLYTKLGYVLENTKCSNDAVVFTKNGKPWNKDPVW